MWQKGKGDWKHLNVVESAPRRELEASRGAAGRSYLVLELPVGLLVLLQINVLKNKLYVRMGEQAASKTNSP
jgi:hypothetical protein